MIRRRGPVLKVAHSISSSEKAPEHWVQMLPCAAFVPALLFLLPQLDHLHRLQPPSSYAQVYPVAKVARYRRCGVSTQGGLGG